jgi:hypothetical protein
MKYIKLDCFENNKPGFIYLNVDQITKFKLNGIPAIVYLADGSMYKIYDAESIDRLRLALME